MKKVILMLVMLFTMSVYSFAKDNTATTFSENKKYELKINHRRLACALGMTNNQMEACDEIISQLEKDMDSAKERDTKEKRDTVVIDAVKKNIKWMHYILDEKQYKNYVTLLNLTLAHRGFDVEKINN